MLTWPRERPDHRRLRQARASASAEAAGTMRSWLRDGDESRQLEQLRPHRHAAGRPQAARRQVGAVPVPQALLRHRPGQRHAVVQPVLDRHEQPRHAGVGRRGRRSAANLRDHAPADRARRRTPATARPGHSPRVPISAASAAAAAASSGRRRPRRRGNPRAWPAAPGRRGPAGAPAASARRQQAAHAVAEQHGSPSGQPERGIQRRLCPSQDRIARVELSSVPLGTPQSSSSGR